MSNYPYVDTTRANADGTFPVYIIVKNMLGRFFVNTGMTTCGKLEGLVFPKGDKNWKQKTTLLGRMLSDVERVCLQHQNSDTLDNKKLKSDIQREVFGIEPREETRRLYRVVKSFANTKRDSTKILYNITSRKIESFDEKATLESVNSEWLESFRLDCISKGMKINGAAKELRNIRAVFNWARRQEMTRSYPFLDYHIVEEETIPNNLTLEQLCKLRDYSCEPWQERYRDFFMLSFYMAGMNPVDLLTAKADSIKDGHISFVRKKTDKEGQKTVRIITLPIVKEAQIILKRYKSKKGWLLNFMDDRSDYHSFVKKANEALKKIGPTIKIADKVGKMRKVEYHPILPDITMYAARYSFGSIAANELDISERTIGMCLGHSWSKQVTSRYISHDQRKVDEAVKRVVKFVSRAE